MAYRLNRTVSAADVANVLGRKLLGPNIAISCVGDIDSNGPEALVFSSNASALCAHGNVCISSSNCANAEDIAVIESPHPRLDFMKALQWFSEQDLLYFCNEPASIDSTVKIGPNVVIEPGCRIARGVVIEPNVVILRGTSIGANTRIRANATIGSDGFGFERNHDGKIIRFIHLGGVRIGSNVEVGAGTCIARGTLGDTVVGDNVKIDNLVHIAHNVNIGSGVFVTAGAEISGSCRIEANAWIGPNACIREKLVVGRGAVIGIGSTVVKDVPSDEVHAGNPARLLRS